MKYPFLTELSTSSTTVDVFKGYNHNLRIGEDEFFDMRNMTSDYYPVLSPRRKRAKYLSLEQPQGLIEKDALCYVDSGKLYINQYEALDGLSVDYDENGEILPKQLVSMGAYIIVMPDKMYVNTKNYTDKGHIENVRTTDGNTVTFTLTNADGEDYGNYIPSAEAPQSPEDGALWLDISSKPYSLKKWSESSEQWVSVLSTYVKIACANIGLGFEVNDGVTISGITAEGLTDLNATSVIWAKADDYIVVTGILDGEAKTQTDTVTVSRTMPAMDFIVESNNRLWGCRYGYSNKNEVVNELYACKLGDFKNWNCFMGISTDSYVVSLGSDGMFTGACSYLGYPTFFKENCLHKVYGSFPAQYQVQTTGCRGVQQGCSKSLAVVNEILFYKSRNGICAYDGSLPTEVSYAFGNEKYDSAVAGVHDSKYYVSMQNLSKNEWQVFVFDTAKQMWHKEDEVRALDWCECKGDLFYIDAKDNCIYSVGGTGAEEQSKVSWMVETGNLGLSVSDKKYISHMTVRMSLEIGTSVRFYVQYDSSREWEHLFTMTGHSLRSFAVPIRPKRCDHFKLKIEGAGNAKIYSITKNMERGSDV